MDYTYGEEIPLDAVAPLFASAARSSANASRSKIDTFRNTSTTEASSTNAFSNAVRQEMHSENEDDEMEEGELLEEGEITEDSSDEAELVAASLIPSGHNAKQEEPTTSQSLPYDWTQRIQPLSSSKEVPLYMPNVTSVRHQAEASPSTTPQPPPSILSHPPRTPTLAEFESLIDELYTYGVTCDYLIGKGVTKDRVISRFAEKGYKVPQHHLDRHLEQQHQRQEHQASLAQQQPVASTSSFPLQPQQLTAHQYGQNGTPSGEPAKTAAVTDSSRPTAAIPTNSHHRATSSITDSSLIRLGTLSPTPPLSAPLTSAKRRRDSQDLNRSSKPSGPPVSSSSSSSSVPTHTPSSELQALKDELARKEASAREALRARKAALAKQNALRAEDFIESLLTSKSAETQGAISTMAPSSSSGPSIGSLSRLPTGGQAIPSTSKTSSQATSDLEDYEDLDTPPIEAIVLPIASTSAPALSRPALPSRLSSTAAINTRQNRQHRAVATDFESDPSHSLPNVPRWSEQLLESSRRNAAHSEMVIHLSDSEDNDDEGDNEMQNSGNDEDDEHLRQAIKDSRLQDSLNHSAYYYHQPSSATSYLNPYHSYTLNNATRPTTDSARSSPAPPPTTTSSSSVPSTFRNSHNGRKVSPPRANTSRDTTPTHAAAPAIAPLVASRSQSTTTTTAVAGGNAELEAKQAEIRKMLEMIEKLESKKKAKQKMTKGTTGTGGTKPIASVSSTTSTPEEAPSLAAPKAPLKAQTDDMRTEETILAAKETVGRLLDEEVQLATSATLNGGDSSMQMPGDEGMEVGGDSTPNAKDSHSPLLSVPKHPAPTLMGRDTSSDEAMSISSGDE